jgi:hypothetical protein
MRSLTRTSPVTCDYEEWEGWGRIGSIKSVFEAVGPARLQIATQIMDLSEIDKAWQAPGKPRIVMTIR